jgi:hypothetical protein
MHDTRPYRKAELDLAEGDLTGAVLQLEMADRQRPAVAAPAEHARQGCVQSR